LGRIGATIIVADRGIAISLAGRIARRHGRALARDARLAGLRVAPAAGRQAVARRATWVAAHRVVRRRVQVDGPRADALLVDNHRVEAVGLPAAVVSHRAVEVDARLVVEVGAHRVVGAADRVHARQAGAVVVADKVDGRRAVVKPGNLGTPPRGG
jgi:hypothetical protein